MPIVKNREYRNMAALMQPLTDSNRKYFDTDYYVEGYATTFDVPYLLYEYDGVKYYECIAHDALDGADLSDVIMQFDHAGKVFARTSNNTLALIPDAHGLRACADLSKSAGAKELHAEIDAKLVTKMSWAFTIEEESYNNKTHTRTITKIKKVYDVSAVSYPANQDTEIAARSFCDGVIAEEKRESLLRRIKTNKILEKIGGNKSNENK